MLLFLQRPITMNCWKAVWKFMNLSRAFVHAKSFASDDEKAVVGTINLDYRSLYLHFECAVMLYKNPEVDKVEADFQETLKKCIAVTKEDYRKQKFLDRLEGRTLRLMAPLM